MNSSRDVMWLPGDSTEVYDHYEVERIVISTGVTKSTSYKSLQYAQQVAREALACGGYDIVRVMHRKRAIIVRYVAEKCLEIIKTEEAE